MRGMALDADALLDGLRRHFGHTAFRPGQRDVVEAVLRGRDAMVVMPTGGGKSLCYQLPAVLSPAPTLVVSPLIALMKDQIDALRQRGVPAAALHSNLDGFEQRRIQRSYRDGAVRLLYVAPERLVRPDLRAMLEALRPCRIVVDEAHCISEWGHDFRRDYLRIGEVAAGLAPVQVVACTATATAEVRADIAHRLGLRDPFEAVHGFARPNLFLAAERVRDEAAKLERLDQVVDPQDGHAIVYAGTRARAATIAARLRDRHPTMLYHAELTAEERSAAQERFASGEVRVAVTTSAFGMGVDIPTVRQVVHAGLPLSLEEYYQQAGRAGRDGLAAACVVVHAPADRRLPEFFIETAHPDAATVGAVHRSLVAEGCDPGAWRLVVTRDPLVRALPDRAGDAARELLREAGVLEGGVAAPMPAHRLPVDHGRVAAHRRAAMARFGRLLDYLSGRGCRHRAVVEYFGETATAAACGDRCDVCSGSAPATGPPLDDTPVRQALSAAARLRGRVGMVRLARVLVGSQSREIGAASAIPTFGALRGWREADVVELLRRLADAGALRLGPPPYPTVDITRRGVEAMRGEAPLAVADPRRPPAPAGHIGRNGAAAPGAPESLEPGDEATFRRLRSWRAEQARDRGVPAYVIFHDRTLAEIARRRPADGAELLRVPGVGEAKLALWGDAVLRVVAAAGPPAGAPGLGPPSGSQG
jgi:ATP-dependent DNA helicase RecQ